MKLEVVYADQPDIEVSVDGQWCAGELLRRTELDDGTSVLNVRYRLRGDRSSNVGVFPEDLVRSSSTV